MAPPDDDHVWLTPIEAGLVLGLSRPGCTTGLTETCSPTYSEGAGSGYAATTSSKPRLPAYPPGGHRACTLGSGPLVRAGSDTNVDDPIRPTLG